MAFKLEISGLIKTYAGTRAEDALQVFNRIDFTVEKGQFFTLVGPSGCGKTTLLRMIAGLETITSGNILLNGERLNGPNEKIGLVFQEYALFPWRKLLENIEVGLEIKGVPAGIRRSRAMIYVKAFGLQGFENRYPKELSGGMKQRVAIARALIANPQVVLMDEPFGSLDSQTRDRMQNFLLKIWAERKDTILFVTHNVDEAVYLSDRIAVMAPRPSRILKIFDLDLKRPRDRTSPEANQLRREILDVLELTGPLESTFAK